MFVFNQRECSFSLRIVYNVSIVDSQVGFISFHIVLSHINHVLLRSSNPSQSYSPIHPDSLQKLGSISFQWHPNLITGLTGYISGDVIAHLIKTHLGYYIRALISVCGQCG